MDYHLITSLRSAFLDFFQGITFFYTHGLALPFDYNNNNFMLVSNHEQTNFLYKTDFKGSIKPDLIKQETRSFGFSLRIHFCMLADPSRRWECSQLQKYIYCVCQFRAGVFLITS
ncbi:hypothetical protein OTU49_005450 [Cherax quadricarinatus]|uniref:Uncharacterized protein n=1 Tax=Cherax quadricarinatus TaxID=27406 RepID=A0AAW0WU30_CHEQU